MKNFVHPLILFLDSDLQKSAQYLTNQYLDKNIKNCCQILVCSLLYTVGIRNRKACKYYFDKERKSDSLNRYFPSWPMKNPPSFVKYNSQESRWCRKCKNHFDVILNYLEELFNEYAYRFGRDHDMYDMLDFLKMEPYHISVRLGIKLIYVKNLKIVLPWKNLPLRYRRKDLISGYREYYVKQIIDPLMDYAGSKRDVPDFITERYQIHDMPISILGDG